MASNVRAGHASPRVSVIMAVRNCEEYLRSCVASLAAQRFTSFEIIIINDGSTDRTSSIIETFQEEYGNLVIIAYNVPVSVGIASARNKALSLASGDYIAVMDGDDLCRPDRLAQQTAFLDGSPGCFCVGSIATVIDAHGRPNGVLDFGVRTHDDVVTHLLAGLNPIINTSAMYRRGKAIEVLTAYAADGTAAVIEDLDFWYRAVLGGLRFHILPDPLVSYRDNPAGHTRTRRWEIEQAHRVRLSEFRRDLERLSCSPIRSSSSGKARCDPVPLPAGLRRARFGAFHAAFLTPILQVGGAEQWMLSLAKRSDSGRLQWTGVALTADAPVAPEVCRELSAHSPVYGVGSAQGDGVRRFQSSREALLAATNDSDVLVTWGIRSLGEVVDAVAAPIVYVSHGSGEWAANCAQAIEKEPVHLAAVSEAARSAFSPAERPRVAVIHNGIEIDRCTPTCSRRNIRSAWGYDDRHRLVGYAGRYSEEKNPAAAALAVTRLPGNFYAIYAGAGRHEACVRAAAATIAGARARFVRPDRRIGNILQAFDVVVLASSSEGFSMLLAEAWHCGVPVVSTRVGAVPELEDSWGPLVAPIPNSPNADQLAEAVELALSDSFQREVVPKARELVAERFTATRMAARWTDFLIKICADALPCAEPSP